jgi:hypothetical protein
MMKNQTDHLAGDSVQNGGGGRPILQQVPRNNYRGSDSVLARLDEHVMLRKCLRFDNGDGSNGRIPEMWPILAVGHIVTSGENASEA